MSDVANILLKIDAKKVELPTKDVEIKRLSEVAGEKVLFTIRAINQDEFEEIQEMATHIDMMKQTSDVDTSMLQIQTILKGVKTPSLRDKDLLKHYGATTPKDLVSKLFLSGEVMALYNLITELSGFGTGAVEEIKKP